MRLPPPSERPNPSRRCMSTERRCSVESEYLSLSNISLSRFPFSKKPFRLTQNGQGTIVEWTTADGSHQELSSFDQYNRLTEVGTLGYPLDRFQVLCDSSSTRFEFQVSSSPATIRAPFLIQNFTYQGHLPITFSLSHYVQNRSVDELAIRRMFRWMDSSLSVEYDNMFRPTMIQCVLGATVVEPLQLTYDEKSSLINEISGYQILSEGAVVRIQGHKVEDSLLLIQNNSRYFMRQHSTSTGDPRV